MKFRKIIYVGYVPLSMRSFSTHYMAESVQLGIEVEYWNLNNIFFKNSCEMEDASHLCYVREFSSYKTLKMQLKAEANSETLFISMMALEGRTRRVYRLFTIYNCRIAVFGRNMLPLPPGVTNFDDFLSKVLRNLNLKFFIRYLKNLRYKFQLKLGRIKNYDIAFIGGSCGWKGIGNIKYEDLTKTNVIKLNSCDYDRYIQVKAIDPYIKSDYILFVDIYLPLHPDTKLFKYKNINEKQYFSEMCTYFDRLENKYNKPVIIAAHPKALKYTEKNYFNGRGVYFDKTAELIKDASIILLHNSTSVNFAIAFNKKIHFITSNSIKTDMGHLHSSIINMAQYLNCSYSWYDDSANCEIDNEVHLEVYNKYKYDYLTWKETENVLSKDIFCNFLSNI